MDLLVLEGTCILIFRLALQCCSYNGRGCQGSAERRGKRTVNSWKSAWSYMYIKVKRKKKETGERFHGAMLFLFFL